MRRYGGLRRSFGCLRVRPNLRFPTSPPRPSTHLFNAEFAETTQKFAEPRRPFHVFHVFHGPPSVPDFRNPGIPKSRFPSMPPSERGGAKRWGEYSVRRKRKNPETAGTRKPTGVLRGRIGSAAENSKYTSARPNTRRGAGRLPPRPAESPRFHLPPAPLFNAAPSQRFAESRRPFHVFRGSRPSPAPRISRRDTEHLKS